LTGIFVIEIGLQKAGKHLRRVSQASFSAGGGATDTDEHGRPAAAALPRPAPPAAFFSFGVCGFWCSIRAMRFFLVFSFLFAAALGANAADAPAAPAAVNPLAADGAKLEKLAGGFAFTEGPAADKDGNVFFTDQPKNKIWKWTTAGKLELFHDAPGRANGLYFDRRGQLLSCSDADNELWQIDPRTRARTTLVTGYDGKKLNGPNDLWVRPDNGVYFTDPMYARPYWKRSPKLQQDGQHVYYLAPDRTAPRRVATDLRQPNGIVGTPDGKFLYIADIGDNKTFRYEIADDGSLRGKKLFAPLGSDGMTLDNQGNVYLTGKGVTVFNAAGVQIAHIAVPGGWTANVCFGGRAHDELFITASKNLWRLKMRVRAAE
jgi:gluconolactonase